MFPKLSQKAWTEIGQMNWRCILNGNDNGMNFHEAVEAFMSLFDLEKYPITWDMMFEYCKTIKIDRIETCKGCVMFFYYHEGECCCKSFYEKSDMVEMLNFLVGWFNSVKVNRIILIGEIHGWWEKGETQ